MNKNKREKIDKELEKSIVSREASLWREAIASVISAHVSEIKRARDKKELKPIDQGLLEIIAQDIVRLKKSWDDEAEITKKEDQNE